MWKSRAIVAIAIVGSLSIVGLAQPIGPGPCRLTEPGVRWLQEALNGWSRIQRDALGLGPRPLPWMVLFDDRCVWHLSPPATQVNGLQSVNTGLSFDGNAIPVYAALHGGTLHLPNGRTAGATATASTSVYGDGSATFSLVAMLSVWEHDPRHARQPHLGEFFQGLLMHELTHSTQLVAITKRVTALRTRYQIPSGLDDDIVQKRFGRVPQFRTVIEAERDVFYHAALATDAVAQRESAAKGLAMARRRRAQFYVGAQAGLRELEDVFLVMEGTAQWAAYQWARSRAAPEVSRETIVSTVRDTRVYWSQDEGLALLLLIDALVPQWQSRMLGDPAASPFALLEEALRR